MAAPLSAIITLLTDFGTKDPFVGVMKGVILTRCPGAMLVDLTHEVPPQCIEEAAFWLEKSYSWFPSGTIHLVVVDPGVGTNRPAVVVRARAHLFVGPGNGVFARVLERDPNARVRRIDARAIGLAPPSRTFHGRDLFAPVAAELARGSLDFERVGPEIVGPATDSPSRPVLGPGEIRGRVVTVDRFGNLVTDIEAELLAELADPVVRVGGAECRVHGTYADVSDGDLLGVVGSSGTLEVARRNGNAQELLAVDRGALLSVRSSAKP